MRPVTEEPSTSFKPGFDERSTNLRPSTNDHFSSLRPGTDEPSTILRPGTDEPTTSLRPGTDEPSTSLRPGTDEPSTSLRPSTDEPSTSPRPGSDEPSSSLRPGTDELSTSWRPGTDELSTSLSTGTDESSTNLWPGSDETSTSLRPRTDDQSASLRLFTDEPSSRMRPVSDESSTSLWPVTDEPSTSLRPVTEEPSTSFKPGFDERSTNLRPSTNDHFSSLRPGTDEPSTSLRPGTDEPSTSLRPGTDEPSTSLSPGTDEPSSSLSPGITEINSNVMLTFSNYSTLLTISEFNVSKIYEEITESSLFLNSSNVKIVGNMTEISPFSYFPSVHEENMNLYDKASKLANELSQLAKSLIKLTNRTLDVAESLIKISRQRPSNGAPSTNSYEIIRPSTMPLSSTEQIPLSHSTIEESSVLYNTSSSPVVENFDEKLNSFPKLNPTNLTMRTSESEVMNPIPFKYPEYDYNTSVNSEYNKLSHKLNANFIPSQVPRDKNYTSISSSPYPSTLSDYTANSHAFINYQLQESDSSTTTEPNVSQDELQISYGNGLSLNATMSTHLTIFEPGNNSTVSEVQFDGEIVSKSDEESDHILQQTTPAYSANYPPLTEYFKIVTSNTVSDISTSERSSSSLSENQQFDLNSPHGAYSTNSGVLNETSTLVSIVDKPFSSINSFQANSVTSIENVYDESNDYDNRYINNMKPQSPTAKEDTPELESTDSSIVVNLNNMHEPESVTPNNKREQSPTNGIDISSDKRESYSPARSFPSTDTTSKYGSSANSFEGNPREVISSTELALKDRSLRQQKCILSYLNEDLDIVSNILKFLISIWNLRAKAPETNASLRFFSRKKVDASFKYLVSKLNQIHFSLTIPLNILNKKIYNHHISVVLNTLRLPNSYPEQQQLEKHIEGLFNPRLFLPSSRRIFRLLVHDAGFRIANCFTFSDREKYRYLRISVSRIYLLLSKFKFVGPPVSFESALLPNIGNGNIEITYKSANKILSELCYFLHESINLPRRLLQNSSEASKLFRKIKFIDRFSRKYWMPKIMKLKLEELRNLSLHVDAELSVIAEYLDYLKQLSNNTQKDLYSKISSSK